MRDELAYAIPLFIYIGAPLLLTPVIGKAFAYTLMVLAVGLTLLLWRRNYTLERPRMPYLSLLVGIAVGALWILLEDLQLRFTIAEGLQPQGMFLAVRIAGALLIAPFTEELFTRGFLARYLSAKDWKAFPLGTFSLLTFTLTALFFGLSHARWFAGIIAGIVFNLLLMRTKSLGDTILSHALSNLIVVAFVLSTGSWQLLP